MEFAVLAGLADDDRERILRLAGRKRYRKGDYLFHEGEHGDAVYLVESGRLVIEHVRLDGTVVGLEVLGPGRVLGEMALVASDYERSASVRAVTDSELLAIDRRSFEAMRADHPSIDRFIIGLLEHRLRRVSQRLTEALHASVEARVLRRLNDLADIYGDTITLSQEELAALAGSTRPSVNRILRRFEDEGLIGLRRAKIDIVDRAALATRAATID